MPTDPRLYTYDGVPTEDSSRGKLAMRNELATPSTMAGREAGCSLDEELLERSTGPSGHCDALFEGHSAVSTIAQLGPPMSLAPTARRGRAAIGPEASNSSGKWACLFFPSSGFGRSARRIAGSTYA